MTVCPRCAGMGIVFECAEWTRTHGACCSYGTHRVGCPGETVPCPICQPVEVEHSLTAAPPSS